MLKPNYDSATPETTQASRDRCGDDITSGRSSIHLLTHSEAQRRSQPPRAMSRLGEKNEQVSSTGDGMPPWSVRNRRPKDKPKITTNKS